MSRTRRPSQTPSPPPQHEDDGLLFRRAVSGAVPIRTTPRVTPTAKPPPVPVQSLLDDHGALAESLRGQLTREERMETGEEITYLREGLRPDTLKKLRRGHWVTQDELDLHGCDSEQARALLVEFLAGCRKRRFRCLRIIHGKGLGSPRKEPVLRGKIRHWLAKREEIYAYCQAPDNMGGSGATLVLLAP